MTQLTILICYGGNWVNSLYKGGKTKALVVSDKVTYEELRDRLYGLIKVDPNEYGIIIKAVYCGKSLTYPVEVVDDDDVTAFICESLTRDWKIPLCITLERRILASGSGSDQRAPISLATQTTEFHSLDQNSISFTSDPLPVDFDLGTQENADCGDDFQNDKQHNSIEVDVEHNNLQCDDVPHANLQSGEVPGANLQFDNVPLDSLQIDNVPHDNMQSVDVPLDSPNSLPNTMLNAKGDMGIGSLYKTKKDLQKKLGLAAIKNTFEFKVKKSERNLFLVVCVNDNCTWRLRAYKSPGSENFMITKYESRHSCSLDSINHSHRQASSSLIAHYVKSKYKGVSCAYKPRDIINDMRKDLGVNVSYWTAWRASQYALEDIRGSAKKISPMRRSCERRKKYKIKSHGEEQSMRKCGKCGSTGHNRQTCTAL